jgi:3-oxoacyl-[acyl-carrier protein] reductase
MGDKLSGKVAVVTGAGRGIGRGHALALAAEGAKVVVNDPGVNTDGSGHDAGPADQVVSEIRAAGGEAAANYDSVAEAIGGEHMIKTALDTFGRLDIIVNNAGILRDRMVFNMTEEEWDAVIAVHLKGHFNTISPASKIFRQQRSGRIINTSSYAGLGHAGQANYSAAKEGIVGLTRTVARELGRYGVTCNAIRPGAATRMTQNPEMDAARARTASAGGGRPAADPADPESIGWFAAYLATDEAGYINGRTFMVRGRQVSLYSEPIYERTIWSPDQHFGVDELIQLMPQTLGQGLRNEWGPPVDPEKAKAPAAG